VYRSEDMNPTLGLPKTECHFPALCCWQESPSIWHFSDFI